MIYALSSSGGGSRSAVAVIRLSGGDSFSALSELLGGQSMPGERCAVVRSLYHPVTGDLLDRALVMMFVGPRSFTGEDMVELHVHGGRAVLVAVLGALSAISGSRYAEAGEFSRRAFSRGKLDFTAAEGLSDLINADTDAQRRLALRQAGGEAYRVYESWTMTLRRMLAYIEACLDFSDEDLPDGVISEALSERESLIAEMEEHIALGVRAELLHSGVRAVIMGRANVGKSSLLNWFAGRDAAIVSQTAGTTRDVIEVSLELGGMPLTLVDTAGLRDSVSDSVEGEGIRRAMEEVAVADLRLHMVDLSECDSLPLWDDKRPDDMWLFNKSDKVLDCPDFAGEHGYVISVSEGLGLSELQAGLVERLVALVGVSDTAVITRERHRASVEQCLEHLRAVGLSLSQELLAEELRCAVRCIGEITGRASAEELLDIIFADFCIGK